MREERVPLYSLENKLPLCEFDIIGFSFMYELCYTNLSRCWTFPASRCAPRNARWMIR